VKKGAKILSETDSYSASEAAALLGISIPTLKRMVAEGRLESFRTPGGHLRVSGDSVAAVRERRPARIHPVRNPSPVLHNRRERLEELTLEAQEMRARRELVRLQREEQAETEQREAEQEAREQEAQEHQKELELEREQLEHASEQERARKENARAIAAFRCQWLDLANQALADPQGNWLSAAQKKEIIDAVEVEVEKRKPVDSPRMAVVLSRTIAVIIERYHQERQVQKRREEVIEDALTRLGFFATAQEKSRATIAARDAISQRDTDVSGSEMLTSVDEAVQPIRQAVENRLLKERLLKWAIQQLPWDKTELDSLRVRRECAEILAELPEDISELEAKEAIGPTVQEWCEDIQRRKARGAAE
jgi:excisionase family DNA binding protein